MNTARRKRIEGAVKTAEDGTKLAHQATGAALVVRSATPFLLRAIDPSAFHQFAALTSDPCADQLRTAVERLREAADIIEANI